MTRRTRGFSLQQLIKELKPYIMGWRGYFGFCQTSASPHEPRSVDPSKIAFVSLAAVANQAKPLQRTTPSRHIEVQCGGGGRLAHGPLANVRTPVGPTGAAQPLFRLARSSPNLCARPSLTRSNRRGTDPYARWCGRGAARHPPIPIMRRLRPSAPRNGPLLVRQPIVAPKFPQERAGNQGSGRYTWFDKYPRRGAKYHDRCFSL